MKKFALSVFRHPLISGSTIIFLGSLAANLFNYLFNLLMGRMLSAPDYGLLMSLSSFIALFAVLQSASANTFTRLSAVFFAAKDRQKIKLLISEGSKITFLFSAALFLLLLIFSTPLANFLHAETTALLVFMALIIVLSLLSSLPFGILQGDLKFAAITVLNIFQTLIKLVLGVFFVYLGFKTGGAIVGILISSFLILFIAYSISLKINGIAFSPKLKDRALRLEILLWAKNFFLAGAGMTILGNSDTILVRHFFSSVESGQYAALSLMGKAIFYFTSPLYFAFFPLIAQKHTRGERLFNTVMLAFLLLVAASAGLSFIYFVFPNIVLKIFFPAKIYQSLASYLGLFSLYILVFSLASLFNNFFLSIGKTFVYKATLFFSLVQIFLIFAFHRSFYQIIGILFLSSFLLLLFFLVYYAKHARD